MSKVFLFSVLYNIALSHRDVVSSVLARPLFRFFFLNGFFADAMALVFTTESEVSLFNLIGTDRLGKFIVATAIKRPYLTVFLACLFSLIAPGIAYLEGNWSNSSLELDVVSDLGWWNQFLLAFPALLFMSAAYFGSFPKTLRQLVDSGVLLATEDDWKSIRKSTKRFIRHPVVTFFPYLFGLGVAGTTALLFLTNNTWIDVRYYLAGWLVPIHVFLLYYLVAFVALRVISAYLVLRDLFKLKVNIQPFHSDGCGGLKSLGDQSSKLTVGIVVLGIIVGIAMYTNMVIYELNAFGAYNLWMLGTYIVTATLAFFLPLYATANPMREAKQNVSDLINQRYDQLNTQQNLTNADQKNISEYGEEDLRAMDSLQHKVRAMQVWPFTPGTIARFAGTIAIPFLGISLQFLLNL